MGFFSPAWKSGNPDKIRLSIERETDQQRLSQIAIEAPTPGLRLAAAKRVTDQELLARLAASADLDVALQAVASLTDQQKLFDAATAAGLNQTVRFHATQRLTDQRLLAEVAVNGGYFEAVEASRRIRDKALFPHIALNSKHCAVRWRATEYTDAPYILARIARTDPRPIVRQCAVKRIDDQELLKELAETAPGAGVYAGIDGAALEEGETIQSVRCNALERIKDKEYLVEYILSAIRDGSVRDAKSDECGVCVSRLCGSALLLQVTAALIAYGGELPEWLIRKAFMNLDGETLASIYENRRKYAVTALKCLTERGLLKDEEAGLVV